VTFPKDYGKEELNGKDAVFETKINYIIEKTVPLYNDKWVADNTDYSTMAEYENSVRKELEDSKRSDAESNERLEVFNQIIEGSEVISFPEAEYQARYDKLVDSYKSYAEAAGTEWDAYLQDQMGMTVEEFENTAKQNAEQTVEAELILNQIARLEKIDLSDEDYKSYLNDMLEQSGYTEKSFQEEKDQTVEEYAADNNLYANYLYKKVMDKVMEYSVAK
jgi:trigger factor